MEKFKALAWHWQLLILVGIASIIYLGVWYFVTSVTRAETQTINDEVSQYQSKNQAAQLATQRINEFRSLYASKSAEYDELKVLLPEAREITNVLQGLQDTARDSRLIVMRFSPRDDTQEDGFMSKPVEVEVDSNFNSLRAFFEKMAKLQRIVSIYDFNLKQLEKQSSDKTLHAQFILKAYYATPEDLTAANKQQPNGATPGAPGANPAPAQISVPNAQTPVTVPAGR